VWVDWALYKGTVAKGSKSVGSEPMGEVVADNEATRVQSALHKTGFLKATLTHVFCAIKQASMCSYTKYSNICAEFTVETFHPTKTLFPLEVVLNLL
jgi:hypothetical protein